MLRGRTARYYGGGGFMPPWYFVGSSIDLDFDNGRYFDASVGHGTLTDPRRWLAISRASTGYAKTAAGTLTSFGNDTLRITDLGLLVEDARTNLQPYSQDLSQTSQWTAANLSITGTATAPDGTNTAQRLVENSTNGYHRYFDASTIGSIGNVAVTGNAFFKDDTRHFVGLQLVDGSGGRYTAVVDLTTGTITKTGNGLTAVSGASASIEAYGNGWYRLRLTHTFVGPTSGADLEVLAFNNNNPTLDSFGLTQYTGDGTSAFYVWGMQVEVGSFPSSYIPTAGSSATRAADAVTVIGSLNTIISGNAQSVVSDVKMDTYNDQALLGVSIQNPIVTSFSNTIADSPSPSIGGATLGNSLMFSVGAKIGLGWNTSARSLVGGGGTVATDATNLVGVRTNNCRLSGNSTGYSTGFCVHRRLTVWNSKLADATLQSLTAP